jgi:hypothetical protein
MQIIAIEFIWKVFILLYVCYRCCLIEFYRIDMFSLFIILYVKFIADDWHVVIIIMFDFLLVIIIFILFR